MEWLPVQIVKPARKSWKILLLEYCSPMSQVYCAGNKATVAPLGWAHHIIDIYRLQKIYNKWVRWGFCEVDIQVETCGAMKRACRGISSFVRGGIASVSCGKKRHLRLTLIWSGSEVGVIVALIYLLLHACLPLIRSYVRAFPWMCKVSKLLQSPNSTHLSVHLSTLIRVQVNTRARHSSSQPIPPAPPVRSRGTVGPDGIYIPSSVFWVCPGSTPCLKL